MYCSSVNFATKSFYVGGRYSYFWCLVAMLQNYVVWLPPHDCTIIAVAEARDIVTVMW